MKQKHDSIFKIYYNLTNYLYRKKATRVSSPETYIQPNQKIKSYTWHLRGQIFLVK